MFRTFLLCAGFAALGACASGPAANSGAKTAANDPNCLSTASRIKQPCADSAAGRSYSREDLDRTGHTNAGAALQQLDPSVTVDHR
jgi:hypothetical protein